MKLISDMINGIRTRMSKLGKNINDIRNSLNLSIGRNKFYTYDKIYICDIHRQYL